MEKVVLVAVVAFFRQRDNEREREKENVLQTLLKNLAVSGEGKKANRIDQVSPVFPLSPPLLWESVFALSQFAQLPSTQIELERQ